MDIPIEILIEEERRRRELEAEMERPRLQLEIPVPNYRERPEIEDTRTDRGVIVVDSEAEECRGVVVIEM